MRRRAITLIEIMIVIALIAIIGGALAVNMRGSLDKGKAFKTEQHIMRIQQILQLAVEESGETAQTVADKWQKFIKQSPLMKGEELLLDGWGGKFVVSYDAANDAFNVTSEKFTNYQKKHG